MPSFGNRHLLRLRRLPRATAISRPAASVRHMNTAQIQVNSGPSSFFPRFPLHPSSHASSSKLTLDVFLNTTIEEDLIASALNFAPEEELMAAALASLPSKDASASSRWIDPAEAYHALRSSTLFNHFLQLLLPRIRTLYANLRPSGMHQVLVSDLLLRNPDARALREILQEEADPAHPHAASDRLGTGLVLQVYRTIAPSIRRNVVPRLSRTALIAVTRALRLQGKDESPELLSGLFYDLAFTTDWAPEGAWPLLEIILSLTRSGHAKDALRLLQYPVQLGRIPMDSGGRTPINHPKAAELMVQTTVVRTLLLWRFDGRAMTAVDDLMNTMVDSTPTDSAVQVVLTACRVAAITGHTEWTQDTLLRIATDDRFPALSTSSIDFHLDALSVSEALKFYTALPAWHAPPSPRNILRLAQAGPTRPLSRRLATDLSRTPQDTTYAIPGILRAFASARMLLLVRAAYRAWDGRASYMDAHTTIALVHAFTRGARNDKNTAFARTVVSDYLEMNGKRVSSVDAALTAIHAYGLIGSPKANGMPHEEDPVAHHVQELVRVLGESGALEHLRSLTLQYPLLAYRLQQVARQNGLSLPTAGVTIAAACAARHWSALPSASAIPLTPDESAYLAVLRVARKARRSAMARHFRTAVTAFPDSPMLVPTAAAALHRLAALRGWAEGLELLALALKGTGAGSSTEAASVFLTAMYREVGGAVVQQASEVARDAAERVEDGARADSGKVSIYIDGRDGAPDAAALRTHAALTAERAVGGAAESHGAAREAWATLRASVVESIQAMDPLERTLLETMAERIDSAVAADSA